MKTIKAYKTLTMKDGSIVNKGEAFSLMCVESDRLGRWQRLSDGKLYVMRFGSLIKPPTIQTMQKWMDSGIAKSVLGARVEPDGHGPENEPSWLLYHFLI